MEKLANPTKPSNHVISNIDSPIPRRPSAQHFHIHKERPFLATERSTTTILTGGLSPAHDYLVEAGLKSLGLKVKVLPNMTLESFHLGREYSNNGLCNPSYFMVGNLIRFLRELEKSGMTKEDIVEQYVFFTAGCNAPCRFGMLETEYRMALQDCGFEAFRVLVFQNEGGLNQDTTGNGLEVNPEFFLALVNALNMADILNDFVYATRPFEVVPGETDKVMQKAMDYLYEKLAHKKKIQLSQKWKAVFDKLHWSQAVTFLYRFIDQITSSYYVDAIKEVRKMFETIEVDRFRSKVAVKITGEFWAMTTVGAGNFHMFRFLEQEGAVLMVEPVGSLIQFLFSKGKLRHLNRREMMLKNGAKNWWNVKTRIGNYVKFQQKLAVLKVGNWLFRREYGRLLKTLGGDYHMLIHQPILQKLGNPYYNINIEGGEGYMEIAKNIYYHEHGLAHMVLSLKPFGCMPSTQSDGAQASVVELNREMIFLPLETAGEGETNAQSRVLMALGDAQIKAKKEMADARKTVTSDMETMRKYVEAHPVLKSPTYVVPRKKSVVNMAANFMYHIDDLIRQETT